MERSNTNESDVRLDKRKRNDIDQPSAEASKRVKDATINANDSPLQGSIMPGRTDAGDSMPQDDERDNKVACKEGEQLDTVLEPEPADATMSDQIPSPEAALVDVDAPAVDVLPTDEEQLAGATGHNDDNNDDGAGPPIDPCNSRIFDEVTEELQRRLAAQDASTSTVNWDAFPNYIGEGVRSRLLTLATLHLSPLAADKVPESVRQLPANANKVLLGAPTNCELYQVRLITALAAKVGAKLLVVDGAALKVDDEFEDGANGVDDTKAGGGIDMRDRRPSFLYDTPSDDDVEDLGFFDELDRRKGGDISDDHPSYSYKPGSGYSGRLRRKYTVRRGGGSAGKITEHLSRTAKAIDALVKETAPPTKDDIASGEKKEEDAAKNKAADATKGKEPAPIPEDLEESCTEIPMKQHQGETIDRKGKRPAIYSVDGTTTVGDVVRDGAVDNEEDDFSEARSFLKIHSKFTHTERLALDREAAIALGAKTAQQRADIVGMIFEHMNEGNKAVILAAYAGLMEYRRLTDPLKQRDGGDQSLERNGSVAEPSIQQDEAAAGGIDGAGTASNGSNASKKPKLSDAAVSPSKVTKKNEDDVGRKDSLAARATVPWEASLKDALPFDVPHVDPATSAFAEKLSKFVVNYVKETRESLPKDRVVLAGELGTVAAANFNTVSGGKKLAKDSIVTPSKLMRIPLEKKMAAVTKDVADVIRRTRELAKSLDRMPFSLRAAAGDKVGGLDDDEDGARFTKAFMSSADKSPPRRASSLPRTKIPITGDKVVYVGKLHPKAQGNINTIQQVLGRIESRAPGTNAQYRLREIIPTLVARRNAAMAAVNGGQGPRVQPNDAPPLHAKGKVVGAAPYGLKVVFDEPFPGGQDFEGEKPGAGYICSISELHRVDEKEDAWSSAFEAVFATIKEQGDKGEPLMVLIQNADRLLRFQPEHMRWLSDALADLPPRCLVFAAFCTRALSREQKTNMGGMGMLFGGRGGGGGDAFASLADDSQPWFDPLSRRAATGKHRKSAKGRLLSRLFPNSVDMYPPNQDTLSKSWRQMVESDVASMRESANRAAIRKALVKLDVECADLDAVKVRDVALGRSDVEQVIGGAIAELLSGSTSDEVVGDKTAGVTAAEPVVEKGVTATDDAMAVEPPPPPGAAAASVEQQPSENNGKLIIHAKHLMEAADWVRKAQEEAAPAVERHALRDIQADQYEKQLLSEVIPPEEIAVGFNDIGALEPMKETLHEVVILPLQRPELFTRGSLRKPTKGLLLFGPPGTGKTMLAKAVASESGAHFINVNMSAITSKWFGEGERLVRALFSLAHKLAPSVIFVDEIDSFLSKRSGGGQEHEALRKMKNEFMQHWDGLRTRQSDRVLVLGATNRPMDLDDAVIRRMPRRIFVPLPDANNREHILKIILKDEETDASLDLKELASRTDGYSGSDLKNLCIAAAYFPVRELLSTERQRRKEVDASAVDTDAAKNNTTVGGAPAPPLPVVTHLRGVNMADFEAAMKQVTSSTFKESATMSELQRWNEQFGEGGTRRQELLHYYT